MKKRNLLFTLSVFLSIICGIGFLAVNIYENASVKPSTITHEGGGGSNIRDYHYSFDTPDFTAMGKKITDFVIKVGGVIDDTAVDLGNQAEENVREFVSEHYEKVEDVSESKEEN